jgi:transaldolase
VSIYLDSADPSDARAAGDLGFVVGATTNPLLIARAGVDPRRAIAALCDALPGTVFYQIVAPDAAEREREARLALDLRPGRVGLKIPCTTANLRLAHRLASEGHVVGVTALFGPSQALLACDAGATYVLPYVNRTTRLTGDGLGLVARIRDVIDAAGAPVEIIAASVKSADEAVATVLAGAHHLTLPLAVIDAMASSSLSEQAIGEFGRSGVKPLGEGDG